jgi:ATP-dependent DNA helicase RecG
VTPDSLRALIAAGESLVVEFKSDERTPFNDRDPVEAVVCLANRIGQGVAHLVVGVEDDGRVSGTRARHGARTDVHKVAAMIGARTRPSIAASVELVDVEGKTVLVIEIPAQRQPIATCDGVFLRRVLGGDGRPACMPMDVYALQSLQSDRGLLDPSSQVVASARWEDLDPLEFERFRRSVRERRGRSDESLLELPDLELAKSLGVVEANGTVRGVKLAALLLFGKEDALFRYVPTHEVAFQAMRALDVEINDFFRWPLLRVMEEIEARIRARNREQELLVGVLRVGVPDYPERALREALANALIHRDYQRLGATHFQWRPDRIEISNPGGFPEGVRLDNLLVTAPHPRNPLLADAFKRAGIVERTARGIDTIYFEQLRNGRAAPSYSRSDGAGVTVVIPAGEANLEFVRLLVTEGQRGRSVCLDELIVLNALSRGEGLAAEEAGRLIQKSEAEALIVLERLAHSGLVEGRVRSRANGWRLSVAACRTLGNSAPRAGKFLREPQELEDRVVKFVEQHGRITRKQAAGLCRVGPYQATRLLDRLVTAGRLLRHGQRKGSWYERGEKM